MLALHYRIDPTPSSSQISSISEESLSLPPSSSSSAPYSFGTVLESYFQTEQRQQLQQQQNLIPKTMVNCLKQSIVTEKIESSTSVITNYSDSSSNSGTNTPMGVVYPASTGYFCSTTETAEMLASSSFLMTDRQYNSTFKKTLHSNYEDCPSSVDTQQQQTQHQENNATYTMLGEHQQPRQNDNHNPSVLIPPLVPNKEILSPTPPSSTTTPTPTNTSFIHSHVRLNVTIGPGPNNVQQQTFPVVYDVEHLHSYLKNDYQAGGGGSTPSSLASTSPFLQIIEQPTNRIRYRYRSEKGSHGGLNGANSSQIKKTYPTIKIENYHHTAPVYIRASLATNEDNPKPHVHKLMGRHCSDDGSCTLPISENMTTIFQNLGILFIGKKEVPEILFKRKLDEMRSRYFDSIDLEKIKPRLHEESEKEAKDMNLNSVRLCFEAFMLQNESLYPICPLVYSRPIANQKSPDSGELKIVRINRYCGSVIGGDEIYLLCEKVNKKEIKVRFFELDHNGTQQWEAFGDFNESDVHHQVAIVFRTPPYHNQNISKPIQVFLQLFRQRDGEYSEPRTFIYKPKNDPKQTSTPFTMRTDQSNDDHQMISNNDDDDDDDDFNQNLQDCVLSRIRMENQPPGCNKRRKSNQQQQQQTSQHHQHHNQHQLQQQQKSKRPNNSNNDDSTSANNNNDNNNIDENPSSMYHHNHLNAGNSVMIKKEFNENEINLIESYNNNPASGNTSVSLVDQNFQMINFVQQSHQQHEQCPSTRLSISSSNTSSNSSTNNNQQNTAKEQSSTQPEMKPLSSSSSPSPSLSSPSSSGLYKKFLSYSSPPLSCTSPKNLHNHNHPYHQHYLHHHHHHHHNLLNPEHQQQLNHHHQPQQQPQHSIDFDHLDSMWTPPSESSPSTIMASSTVNDYGLTNTSPNSSNFTSLPNSNQILHPHPHPHPHHHHFPPLITAIHHDEDHTSHHYHHTPSSQSYHHQNYIAESNQTLYSS